MSIMGCDFHSACQQVAWVDSETRGTPEGKLEHSSGEAREFYASFHPLPQVVLLDCMAVAESVPLAYLITFRSYGTWLHGDPRGSVDRFHNQYGEPVFPPNAARLGQTEVRLKRVPVVLTAAQRQSVDRAIRETSDIRSWLLRALTVRTNHVHAVISTEARPDLVLNALKANATRQLRQDGCWEDSRSPWSDGGSRRYVWTEAALQRVIDYVINGQDGDVPENVR